MPLFRRGRSAEARDALPPLAEVEQQRERDVEDEAAMLQEMQEELSRLAAENHRMRDETRKYLRETDQREADCECVVDQLRAAYSNRCFRHSVFVIQACDGKRYIEGRC